jgi:hypothetical protein
VLCVCLRGMPGLLSFCAENLFLFLADCAWLGSTRSKGGRAEERPCCACCGGIPACCRFTENKINKNQLMEVPAI